MDEPGKKIKQILQDLRGLHFASNNTKNVTPLNLWAHKLIDDTIKELNTFADIVEDEKERSKTVPANDGIKSTDSSVCVQQQAERPENVKIKLPTRRSRRIATDSPFKQMKQILVKHKKLHNIIPKQVKILIQDPDVTGCGETLSPVVDMRTVLEVVSVLEDFPVTKETLGDTRVGKYVNEMRRKTNDKDLARRSKNLVRRWKTLVDAATTAAGGGAVNGEGIAPRPAATGGQPPQPIPPHLSQTAGRNNSKPSSPASRPTTPSSGKSTQSPSLPSRSRPDTPSAVVSRPNTPLSTGHVQSPGLSLTRPGTPGSTGSPLTRNAPQDITTAATPTQGNNSNSRYGQQALPNRSQGAGGPMATSTPIQPAHQAPSGTTESLLKTNATNKKRRRDADSPQLPNKKLLLSNDSPDGSGAEGKSSGGPRNGIVPGLLHGRSATSSRPDSPLTCDKSAVSSPSVSGVSRLQRTGTPPSVPSPPAVPSTVSPTAPTSTTTTSNTPSRSASQAVKAEVDRPRDRTPAVRKAKVKTTAELIQDMKARGNLQLGTSEVSNRIARNQIEKEEDPINVSIVPAGARPRPRRKPGTVVGPPSISEKTLKETKTEMVQKFLQNSFNPQLDAGESFERATNSPYSKHPRSRTASPALLGDSYYQNNNGSANTSSDSNENQIIDVETPFFTDDNRFGHIRGDDGFRTVPVIEEDDDPWSTLPPLLPETEIDWSEYVYEPPDTTVTDSHVDRLHSEHWEGVNGQTNSSGEWVDWTGMHTVSTHNDELLPILPYVDIID